MHAVWVDNGSDYDPAKLKKHDIDTCYFDPRDSRITADYLDKVVTAGYNVGVYQVWNWYPTLTGAQFAEHCHNDLLHIHSNWNPPVCFDIETHDINYILDCFARWRQLRPSRATYWTLEGFQGGLFTTELAQSIAAKSIIVCPSFYAGDMSPLGHSVVIDMLMARIPGFLIKGMYDAAVLPYRWDGFAFTQGRLPA